MVLKGSGRDRTILHVNRPIEEGYRPNLQSTGNSRWSWTGGQIWVMGPERKALSEAEDYASTEGWLLGDTLAEVSAASRGQRTLMVSSTEHLAAGDLVVLETDNPAEAGVLRHLAGDVGGTREYDWPVKAPQLTTGPGGQYVQYASLQWPAHHSFACRMQSHDNLVDGFEIEQFSVPLPSGSLAAVRRRRSRTGMSGSPPAVRTRSSSPMSHHAASPSGSKA